MTSQQYKTYGKCWHLVEIMQTYLVDSFRLDRDTARTVQPHRVEGVGELQFSCQLSADGLIENPRLSGDFFPLKDIDS